MSYAPTTWVEKVTKLGPTNMNHLEQGVATADATANAALPTPAGSNGQFLKKVGGVWVPTTFALADLPANIPASQLANYPTDATKVLKGDGSFAVGDVKLDDQLLGVDGALNLTVPAAWKYGMLRVIAYIRTATAIASEQCLIRLNVDGTSTYTWNNLTSAAAATNGTNTYLQAGSVVGASGTAGCFSRLVFDVIPGASGDVFKAILGRSTNPQTPLFTEFAGHLSSATDLSSINIQALGSTNMKSGSRAILLGVA